MHGPTSLLALALVAAASAHAGDTVTPSLTIENVGETYLIRKFENSEPCSSSNRGQRIGVSGRAQRSGTGRDQIRIELEPGKPVEFVAVDAESTGGRFRIEPEEGIEYRAAFLHVDGAPVVMLQSRPLGSEDAFALMTNAPDAAHASDVCPEANWSRVGFRKPSPAKPSREHISSPVQTEAFLESRRNVAPSTSGD